MGSRANLSSRWSTAAIGVVAVTILGAVAASPVHAAFNLASDFSVASNPNGPYTYGSTPTLGGTFTPYTASLTDGNGIAVWYTPSTFNIPGVAHNTTANDYTSPPSSIRPFQLVSHPDFGTNESVIRFTVPASGLYTISAAYEGESNSGTSTDVYILRNSNTVSPLFSGSVNGYRAGGPSYSSGTLSWLLGDQIDFVVTSRNGDAFNDSTAIAATITQVPEPLTPGAALVVPAVALVMKRRGFHRQ
jgi:hypothetical protein